MTQSSIQVKGAKEHNLKNIDVTLPRNELVVITGVSGSGKSSLAFDTIYAEGQRRYVESLSAYARQFLDQMEKPDVESIEGLSPAISIEQKTTSRNPRSTVATVTEIYDYLRLLFARIGKPHCPQCGEPIESQSASQIIETIIGYEPKTALRLLAPVVRDRKGEYRKLFVDLKARGYTRAIVDGEEVRLDDPPSLDKNYRHTIEVVIDRIKVDPEKRDRIADSVELALELGEGLLKIDFPKDPEREAVTMSEHLVCLSCTLSFPELQPRDFSFNSPHGACGTCDGLGEKRAFDEDLVVPDPKLTLAKGAVAVLEQITDSWLSSMVEQLVAFEKVSKHKPFNELPAETRKRLLYGDDQERTYKYEGERGRYAFDLTFEGVIPHMQRRYRDSQSQRVREMLQAFMAMSRCVSCGGHRLKPMSLAVKIRGENIAHYTHLSVADALAAFENLALVGNEVVIAEKILKEISERLRFLNDVGLGYLTLDRSAGTLSGGESQRIRLATQIGSKLTGVLYVLDEPSIGLHQRDNRRLLDTLKSMRDLGNTVLVVEHDEETIAEADFLVDIGPGAGEHGGEVIFAGKPEAIKEHPTSLTGMFLSGRESIEMPTKRRTFNKRKMVKVKGAAQNNLKNVDVAFPSGVFTCVTGVSGSGKSTLVHEILSKSAQKLLNRSSVRPGKHKEIKGLDQFDKIIEIDQSPIGRTPRSNPATYVGLFGPLRELFAAVPESRARGYKPGRFSFNVKGGRCETCEGAGVIKIEMHFLPDVYVTCEECKGRRYNRETLEIRYRGKTIDEVLNMTVEDANTFFENVRQIKNRTQTLMDVGLSYIRLGQPATTLSGGEAQRVKLSKELSKRDTGNTLYILDEPTTGLHFADVKKLLAVIQRLTDHKNTIVVIEHNLDVIRCADYIIDMGPEGGIGGGQVVAVGTPEEIAKTPGSHTGEFLRPLLLPN
ncbi:excinuclease ABC subunit UvrA [Acanthopleuribacter pedis]|uniref:UvrABC system protein A n=1 Tax=Acanthopleuribacter pedis TaxID=442870 RepID=A0A8J7Q572_9BACT|nr:excinuclease ABC subunit UvrA [Acanthopleuribacter pedis]MBO1318174.1 excinuclease ABC subunit UvrA [Acanthopleuribacter pedis]